MRITNGMMINNTINNISLNKYNVDKLATQQATEKNIQKPSDDPIIAIRALRFRSQLAEIDQYLTKNIPDAESWLDLTEGALTGVSEMLSSMQAYLGQGANDPLDTSDRDAVIKTLKNYREQIYQNANADFGGRRIFSGYKTDTDMTFSYASNEKYDITQPLTPKDFTMVSKVFNTVDVSNITNVGIDDMPTDKTDIHRIRLAYNHLSTKDTVTINGLAAGTNVIKVVAHSDGKYYQVDASGAPDLTKEVANPYLPGDDDIYFLGDTGELVFGTDAYKNNMENNLTISYTKDGFSKGDLRPEHFFDCQRYKADGTAEDFKFENSQQDINYTVNFNQKLKVNTEGKNLFTHDVVRDLDELIESVENLSVIDDKITKLKSMMEDSIYTDAEKKDIKTMLEAAEKELALADDIMQKRFEKSIGLYQKHQKAIDQEVSDIGARDKRLALNKTRLTSQSTTVEELKSKNEDADLPEVIIKLGAASMVYEASLSAASKVLTKSLLDYI